MAPDYYGPTSLRTVVFETDRLNEKQFSNQLNGDHTFKTRKIASQIGLDEGAVTTALSRLEDRDLVDEAVAALIEELRRIKEKASRFSAVANRNAICWHTRSRRLLGTGMNPTTVPQEVSEMSVGCVNPV